MAKPLIDTLDNNFIAVLKGRDLTGETFNNWKVLGYKGNQCWLCECQCDNKTLKILRAYDLKSGASRSCGCTRHNDLKGQQFGNWLVLQYAGEQKWLCECQCNNHTVKEVKSTYLLNGASKSCGCIQRKLASQNMQIMATSRTKDIKDKIIGIWKATEYAGAGEWKFECTVCGNIITCRERDITEHRRCKKHQHPDNFNNLEGKIINNWKVLRYTGDKSWECECQCENKTIKTIKTQRLISGDSKSCGCKNYYYSLQSYGYNEEQIELILNKDKLIYFIKNKFKEKPTLYDLSKALDIKYQLTVRTVNKLGLREFINYDYNNSHLEKEILDWLLYELNVDVVKSDRKILDGLELDMYIPSHKLALEFNGTYWHSTIHKDKYYHQQKTVSCAKQGIRLIHIFEYEWIDIRKQSILKKLIVNALGVNKELKSLYARNTIVKHIDSTDAKKFLNEYHIQGYSKASINIGCLYNNKLIGVITFSKPRFNFNYEYEIIRLCWHPNFNVTGGTEKLFSYFLKNYSTTSIITYSDISKFTGNVYTRLGFKPIQPNPITEPNYVWVDSKMENIYTRYQTMKHKLIEQNLGTESETEDEIMSKAGYYKVYDSGNIKLSWIKGD